MVIIEDRDRLAELMLMFMYEEHRQGGSYCKMIGEQDAALLRRVGARVSEPVRPTQDLAHATTFFYRDCTFRYAYMIADKVMNEPTAGLPC